MTYEFTNKVIPLDFFKLSMSRTYRSLVGVCNIVFTAAMIAVTIHFWDKMGDVLQVILLLVCLIFPVFQPMLVYLRSRTQAALIPRDLKLMFDDYGLHVSVGDKKQDIGWKHLALAQERGMLFVNSDARHGYVITNRMLKGKREEFVSFMEGHLKKYS